MRTVKSFIILWFTTSATFPVTPNDLPKEWSTPTHLKLTMQARSNEVDSSTLTVRIKWDGGWSEPDAEMGKHLDVEY